MEREGEERGKGKTGRERELFVAPVAEFSYKMIFGGGRGGRWDYLNLGGQGHAHIANGHLTTV